MKNQRRFFLSRVLIFISAGLPFLGRGAFASSDVPKNQRLNSFRKLRYRIVCPPEKARHKDDPLEQPGVVNQVDSIDREFIKKGLILSVRESRCGDRLELFYDFRDVSAFNQWESRISKIFNYVPIAGFGYQFETQYI